MSALKPHLKLKRNMGYLIWVCKSEQNTSPGYGPIFHTIVGVGTTPDQAYQAWKRDYHSVFLL